MKKFNQISQILFTANFITFLKCQTKTESTNHWTNVISLRHTIIINQQIVSFYGLYGYQLLVVVCIHLNACMQSCKKLQVSVLQSSSLLGIIFYELFTNQFAKNSLVNHRYNINCSQIWEIIVCKMIMDK